MPFNCLLVAMDLSNLVNAVCQALLHSLWLGVVAALLAGIVIVLTTRSQPAVRYYLLISICGLFVLASLGFFCLNYQDQPALEKSIEAVPVYPTGLLPMPGSLSRVTSINIWQTLIQFTDTYSNVIVVCWLFIVIWKSIKLVSGLSRLQKCRMEGIIEPSSEWRNRLQSLGAQLNIRKMVQVLESSLVKVPCTIGYFKPVILVPLGMFTMLSPSQVESILLHELAHIKRKDFAINIMLECVEAIFFFNPGIRWLLSIIRQEREVCCDAMVTACNDKSKQYMEALVSFQEKFGREPYMMPLTGRNSLLFYRIKRIISKKNKNLTFMEKLFLSLSIMAVVSLSFIPAGSGVHTESKPAKTDIITSGVKPKISVGPKPETALVSANLKKRLKTSTGSVVTTAVALEPLQDSIVGVHKYTIASPSKRTDYTEIKVASGRVYKIAKEKGTIVSFSVNGVEMDVKEAEKYMDMINTAETRSAEAEHGRHKMEQERIRSEHRRREAETKAAAIEHDRHKIQQESIRSDQSRKQMETKSAAVEINRVKRNQERLEAEQSREVAERKRRIDRAHRKELHLKYDSIASIKKQDVRDIIQYIVKSGIAKNAASIEWFALTSTAFIVNGKTQEAAMHQQLAKTYGIVPELGLYFGDVPGPAKGYFFGKRDPGIIQ